MDIVEEAKIVKAASEVFCFENSAKKNEILRSIKLALVRNMASILKQNSLDVSLAEKNGLTAHLIDRLTLNETRIVSMADSIEKLVNLPDPVNEVVFGRSCENGLQIEKVRVPFGVIGIIYEARPNVTVDAAALCIKSGNSVLLRGGREAINTNLELVRIMKEAIRNVDVNDDIVGFVSDLTRDGARRMMGLRGILDLLIPRGSKSLIDTVVENASVPVIETGAGNCHVYIDESADFDLAVKIVVNSKVSRPSVCNSAESLVVHEAVAERFLKILKREFDELKVELFGCEKTLKILPSIKKATEEDYYAEYNDLKMSVKIVSSLEDAIRHINFYSTGHSEAIVTSDYFAAEKFLKLIDSAAVYVNASTRFTDGEEFGFGAEVGISTQKLHARGPMGLCQLTTEKFLIRGSGQVR